jgi:hypothetical protein
MCVSVSGLLTHDSRYSARSLKKIRWEGERSDVAESAEISRDIHVIFVKWEVLS